MSLSAFDDDSQQLRVFIPPVKKLPPNPHIGSASEALIRALAPPTETEYTDSEANPEPPEEKSLRHRLLACDQRSFVTGSASADLQAARVINAVRKNPERKRQVEDLLSQQRLQDPSMLKFLLDSPTNAILLEATLHVHWGLYGTFCVVPSESDARAMLDALNKINEAWNQNASEGYVRPLDISRPPFAKPHWDIVILHPHALLPDHQPLVIAQNPPLYVQGQPIQPTPSYDWTYWFANGDQLCSTSPPHTPLAPFVVKDVRSHYDKPHFSSLAMVVNAHYKLNQFMRDHGSSATRRVQNFAQQMSDLVTAIFFVPEGYGSITSRRQSSRILGRAHRTAIAAPSHPALTADLLSAPRQGQNPGEGGTEGSSDLRDNGPNVAEPPETPDTDGLTPSEFRLLADRAKDPFLDSKERAGAAVMMIFGTHRYEDPLVGVPAICG
ncbi:hypothetical protein D9615_010021 [Tricholomella constricta]|uniref:Uncharacterized protein n=1 Tax=Tricholomella constricta TaxID=117010 RepID=A0A8H5GUB1_9AGAR|nr:hypothetical protein D9615_010021 [Tricholomella constricta]